MRIQAVLNENVTKLWLSVAERPEFEGATTAVIVNRLLLAYLTPQVASHATSCKPPESDEPKISKVEQRTLDAREAYRDAQLAPFRTTGRWPKPYGLMDEIEVWLFPDGGINPWTPPDDYPGLPHTGEDVFKPSAEECVRAFEDEKQAFIDKGGVVERLEKVAYTPTRPLREEYDTEAEWLAELEMFDANI